MTRNGTEFENVIRTILEYALIYSELFKFKVHPESERYQFQETNDLKRRAIKAMRVSMEHDPHQMGLFWALWGYDQTLTREEFIKRMSDSKCSWIFDEKHIRLRMWKSFSNLQTLDNIEKNEGTVEQ